MRGYYETSRSHTCSLLFALPLLVLYELGAAWIARQGGPPLRNGADVLLRSLLAASGVQSTLAFTAALAVGAVAVVAVEQRRSRVRLSAGVFAGMAAESVAYALAFGVVVGTATQWLVDGLQARLAADAAGGVAGVPLRQGIVLALGAGIYEELVFRVLVAGGIYAVFRAAGLSRGMGGTFAAILSALVFSAFHYVGPYAYPLELASFSFRFLAGLALSTLFLTRGFGIAAWTHALYDVFLLLARHG